MDKRSKVGLHDSVQKSPRRSFLKSTVAGTAVSLPARIWANVPGANDDIRIAIVGIGRKGPQHIKLFRQIPGVRVVALCDCDTAHMAPETAKFKQRGELVETYVDYRKLLENKNIDAVAIATPNHWHALMTVWGCHAGKDVYVEKPVSHSIHEGRLMVEAARKYDRIVQAGTQNRSDVGLKAAREWLHAGNLGKIKLARGFDYPRNRNIGKTDGPQPLPETLDYNLFQGPAPIVPLRRKELHYDWHWFWDTGDGDTGNRGIHTMDHVRWMIGMDSHPNRIISVGGRVGFYDDGETPNIQLAWFEGGPAPILWELKSLPEVKDSTQWPTFRRTRTSMIIECEGGYLMGGRGGARALDWNDRKIEQFPGDGGKTHQANFIKAMRSRNRGELEAEILEGHISTSMCHLANIAVRTGYRRSPDEIRQAVAGPDWEEAVDRMLENLKANEVDLNRERLALGPALNFDSRAERFSGEGSRWANMFLEKQYRPPFTMDAI